MERQDLCHRYASRESKAYKILSLLEDYINTNHNELFCLDVGCSSGIISSYLGNYFKKVVGIDIDRELVEEAAKSDHPNNTYFSIASGSQLPFNDNSFDVIVCAQVYEHMDNHDGLFQEIYRVLRSGGFLFFSGPNRLIIMEEHYWLPFLSWFPKSVANVYLRLFKHGTQYDINSNTYWQLRKYFEHYQFHDCTVQMIEEPEKFFMTDQLMKFGIVRLLPNRIIRLLAPFYPNFNWVLQKK